MAILLSRLNVRLSWLGVLKRTLYEAFWKDNCFGMAAQLAYYFFFGLFPALLVLIAIASYFPVAQLIDQIVGMMSGVVPPEVIAIVREQIQKISNDRQGGLLTFGLLAALWTSSTAMTNVVDTFNRAYGIADGRPWWHVRLIAIALTVGLALFILVSFALVLAGPPVAEYLAGRFNLGEAFVWTWNAVQWPLVFALASTGIGIVYYFAPDVEQQWRWLTPGAVLATALWLGASLGFRYYVTNVGSYTETYGAIGGVMVLLTWFYVSALVFLVGAEINAVIEHASPDGKDPGEKVVGQKRRLGISAMRAWVVSRRRRGERPPTAGEVRDTVEAAPDAPADGPSPFPVPAARPALRSGAFGRPRAALSAPAGGFGDALLGMFVVSAHVWWALRSISRRTLD